MMTDRSMTLSRHTVWIILPAMVCLASAFPFPTCAEDDRLRVEKAVSQNPELESINEKMNNIYQLLQNNSSGKIRKGLLDMQHTWVSNRNRACATDVSQRCLAPFFAQRLEELVALRSALNSDPDGALHTLNPLILKGRWTVVPLKLYPEEARQLHAADIDKQIIEASLPTAGQLVIANAEGLNFGGDRMTVTWSRTKLSELDGARDIERAFNVEPEQVVLVGKRPGKWGRSLNLIVSSNGEVNAILPICAPSGDCWTHMQKWIPEKGLR